MHNIPLNTHIESFDRESALVDEVCPLTDTPLNLEEGNYVFFYDYPMNEDVCFNHRLTPAMSVIDVLLLATEDYKEIYKDYDNTWGGGHSLNNLFFETVRIAPQTKEVCFNIGS
jgi:hypothetical protein